MILTADDFGISPAVDEAILLLIEKDRISSTSCMVTGDNPDLRQDLSSLKKLSHKIDVGLHLVLTEAKALATHDYAEGLTDADGNFFTLKALAARAYSGRLNKVSIEKEIRAQIESFVRLFGRVPDFIDGHQHVQQLPTIKDAVISTMKIFDSIIYVRAANLPTQWLWNSAQSFSLRFALENLALTIPGRQASAAFSENNVRHNRYLLGYYRHTPNIQFNSVFKKYLTLRPQSDDIFFCHPGYIDEHLKRVDTLVESRKDNLNFLMSAEFEDLHKTNQISINRFPSVI